MSEVQVQLPGVLAQLVDCDRMLAVEGETVGAALQDLARRHPGLALHLFDEHGELRRHVLCFHNDVQARDRADLDHPLAPRDRLTIVNSVAGG